jgi:hypothetical protein
MSTFNVSRSLQSFVALPILATNLLIAPIAQINELPTAAVSSAPQNRPLIASATDNQQKVHAEEVAKMKAYFADRHLQIAADQAEMLVTEAEKNNLDWTLLAGIEMIESTGCEHERNNNCFGWGSANIKFSSVDEGIKVVAENLGGNDPDTAKWYKGKTTEQILRIYNPPTIVATYTQKVEGVMNAIKDYPIPDSTDLALASS